MRPVGSFCGSPTYELSKYLTTILKPLTNEFRHKHHSHQFSARQQAHKADTFSDQHSLFRAAALAIFQFFHTALFLSLSTVLLQVVFGLPLALRPSGVHPNAVKQSFSPLSSQERVSTCPNQFHLLRRTSQLISLISAISTTLLFVFLCCHSTETFIDAIKTVKIPDDYKLASFDVKSLFTSIPLQLALDCTAIAIMNSRTKLPLPTDDLMDLLNLCLTYTSVSVQRQALQTVTRNSYGLTSFRFL